MSTILPYDKRLEEEVGAFITPPGEILIIKGKHEIFAQHFCLGPDYDYLTGAKSGPLQVSYIPYLDLKNERERQKWQVDAFSSSKLSVRELEKLKVWLNNHNSQNTYSDFLVYALCYDKVERKVNKLITSTATDPHIRFFNYYLMDWKVEDPRETILYKSNSENFRFSERDYSYRSSEDLDAEEEIDEITSMVPLSKRPLFFK